MASFQAKQVGKGRERDKKNFRSVSFLPDPQQKIPKKQQKNSKNQKLPLWLLVKPKLDGKGREREKIKIIVLFRSVPFQPNRLENIPVKQQKNSKNKKIPL